MTPERWQEVMSVLAAALEREPVDRPAYLDQVCTEPSLRREVESLIAAEEQGASNFLEHPPMKNGALKTGTKLGQYEILAPLGSGGMGEVFRAHDTKLKRDVAIKVLPLVFVNDPERLSRFQREARMLASLNHPNIASIYGLEDSGKTHALVMELIEGPTLADRLRRGPIPIEEALPIAKQMAEALEYAHEHGIIHRDLKPANVKVSSDDTVKVLDFGLAKVMEKYWSAAEADNSTTISQMATEAGVLLGTAAYMSPEQAKCKPVDRRADIWAFGCVLYEMLTGKMAFHGDAVTDTLAAVLMNDPDWSELPAATPTQLHALLQRCLQKDPKQRLQAIGDARISLEEILSGSPEPSGVPDAPLWRRTLPWALFGATALAFAILAWVHDTAVNRPVPAEAIRLQIPLPMKPSLRITGLFALSPDGRQLAFVATSDDGIHRIWIRYLNSLEMRPLPGTESMGGLMFWSPDSRFIAFGAAGKLRKIDISGGPAETVCILKKRGVGGSWNKDGVIIFGQFGDAVMRVSASGGVATPLTVLDTSHGDVAHTSVQFLPDGRHFLYYRDTGTDGAVSVGSLDAKPEEQDSRRLFESSSGAAYVASSDRDSGRLLFLRGKTLMAQSFDARRLNLSGDPVRVVEEPLGEYDDSGDFSVSTNGTLAYWSTGNVETQLTWLDAQGKVLSTVGEPGSYRDFALSPDGTRAFVSRLTLPEQKLALWLLDLSRGTSTRFELDPATDNARAVWAPDGRKIIFGSVRAGQMMDIYEKPVNGAAGAEALINSNEWKVPLSWSPDGRFLLYGTVGGGTKRELWVLPLGDHAKPVSFLRTEFNDFGGRFSPDGRWVAYVSDESGRGEVYVRPFSLDAPRGGISGEVSKWLISSGGGDSPIWGHDGKELYYIDRDGKVMAVKATTGSVFQASVPRALFQAPSRSANQSSVTEWAPSPDGKRFLFLVPETQREAPFTVVLNWQAALKK
jgi:eukaryotic-like serine/threonine-protein kinase